MLKGKKTAGGGGALIKRLAGCIPSLFMGVLLMAFVGLAPLGAGAKSFSGSSARDGGTEMYFENNKFGTSREAGQGFWTEQEGGDKHFRTPDMPKVEEPAQIEILPIQPDVYPVVPPVKPPIVIWPGSEGSK